MNQAVISIAEAEMWCASSCMIKLMNAITRDTATHELVTFGTLNGNGRSDHPRVRALTWAHARVGPRARDVQPAYNIPTETLHLFLTALNQLQSGLLRSQVARSRASFDHEHSAVSIFSSRQIHTSN